MSAPVVAFFNNKGGVGKTSLAYHLAWMYAEKGRRVLAVDLDPQANLTAAFLPEERLERLWPAQGVGETVYGSVSPLLRGVGDIAPTPLLNVADGLALLPGDLGLSRFEDELSQQWPDCLDGKERAFRVISPSGASSLRGPPSTGPMWSCSMSDRTWERSIGPPSSRLIMCSSPWRRICSACRACATSDPRCAPGARSGRSGWSRRLTPGCRCQLGGCSRSATSCCSTACDWDRR